MDLKSFSRKPLSINAVQVTDDNMEEIVATYPDFNLEVRTNADGRRYIKVPFRNKVAARLSMAFPGDWITISPHTFVKDGEIKIRSTVRMYRDSALKRDFEENPVWTEPPLTEPTGQQPTLPFAYFGAEQVNPHDDETVDDIMRVHEQRTS